MATSMNGGAAEVVTTVAAAAAEEEQEEFNHTLSFKGNLAVSICVACLAGLAMCSEVGPVMAACSAGLAGAASFGWGVYLGGVPPECDDYH